PRAGGSREGKGRIGYVRRPMRASSGPGNRSLLLPHLCRSTTHPLAVVFALLPLGHLVERNVQPRAPEVDGKSRLVFERGKKVPRFGQCFPDLRQKGGAAIVELECHAIDARAKARTELALGDEAKALRGREQRDFNPC